MAAADPAPARRLTSRRTLMKRSSSIPWYAAMMSGAPVASADSQSVSVTFAA